MIIGHIGVALAAKRRWQRVALGALLVATFAPDLLRLAFAAAGIEWQRANFWSHALPWSALLAIAAALAAWNALHDRTAALLVAVVVLSHIALDYVSGHKPLWRNGPLGLDYGSFEQLELVIEASLLLAGWYLLKRAGGPRWATHWAVPVVLVIVQAVNLAGSISQRPYRSRCLAYPIAECTEGSWATTKWDTQPFW